MKFEIGKRHNPPRRLEMKLRKVEESSQGRIRQVDEETRTQTQIVIQSNPKWMTVAESELG